MVGYSPNYPRQVHHRASSIVSYKEHPITMIILQIQETTMSKQNLQPIKMAQWSKVYQDFKVEMLETTSFSHVLLFYRMKLIWFQFVSVILMVMLLMVVLLAVTVPKPGSDSTSSAPTTIPKPNPNPSPAPKQSYLPTSPQSKSSES